MIKAVLQAGLQYAERGYMAKDVRMSDIAKILGVSTVTVSKALSDQKGVSEQMREKIKELAEEMGYKAPGAGKADRGERGSYNVGVLVADTYIERYSSFYWEFYQKINASANRESCFVILEMLSETDEKNLTIPKVIAEKKIDGMLILGRVHTEYLRNLQEHSDVPIIYMDFYDHDAKADSVISNSFYGAYHITNYLFELGHKRIAYVGSTWATDSILDRYLGYQKALLEHGMSVRQDWVLDDREEGEYIRLLDEIALPKEMPTAFVCNSDLTASVLIKTLNHAGLRVPEDVSVAGYDDYLYPGLCDVPLTTYSVDMDTMAHTGIKMLIRRINGKAVRCGMQVVEGNLVVRRSTMER